MDDPETIYAYKRRISELECALAFETQEKKYLLDSLRDEFAKAALVGILTNQLNGSTIVAQEAYQYADAMLEARKENK